MNVTRIGGPTVLVELDGWRILVDPTFDAPGRRYSFGLGTSSVKTRGPSVPVDELGEIDVILVSHDHHADNLDDAGRALLPGARHVVTTVSGAGRLGLPNAHGLATGDTILLEAPGREPIRVGATPCRHGPPLSRRLVGDVIGFTVRRQSRAHFDLWATGDTVLTRRLRRTARHMTVDVAIVNGGGVQFGITGPVRYSMTGTDAAKLIAALEPAIAIPAHYDGWSHFRDGEAGMRTAIATAPAAVRDRVRWLPDGEPVDLGESLDPQKTAP
ncbi:MBL fold metallo-hydrolase [Microbacterium sp. NPDC057407]|uniref:MBL fold metallo-hydrolase n=1 Tax=Microbacterium sp. NPDC057407 TaxID=3346120 RepID=UPI003671324F